MGKDEAFSRLVSVSRRIIASIASGNGITVLVEPLRRGECNIINTVEEGAGLCEAVDDQSFSLMADIYHMESNGEPLDEAVYCEVMFDKEISGEVPEHRDFIYTTAIPALERRGVKVTVLRSEKTYVDLFTGKITRGPKKGLLRSFPICGRCAVQRDCKLKPILRYQKSLPPDTVQYIGIAKDEQERLLRLAGNRVSLLDKYNCTEEDAKQLCQRAGLLSPVYTFTNRGGCWFCPNAKRKELRHLYDYHPNLWERMLELQALPNKVSEKFNRRETFSDIDEEFRLEDAQESLFQNAA